MDFGRDKNTLDITQEFMYGPAFLVCPVTSALYYPYDPKLQGPLVDPPKPTAVKDVQVYLPAGTDWYDFRTGEKYSGGRHIGTPAPLDWMPLFVRAGSLVPMGKVIQNTTTGKQAEIELRIYPGADADFTLYDDDGVSYDYEKGASTEVPLHWDNAAQKLTIGDRKGGFATMLKELVFKPVLVGKGKGVGSLTEYDGEARMIYTGSKIDWHK